MSVEEGFELTVLFITCIERENSRRLLISIIVRMRESSDMTGSSFSAVLILSLNTAKIFSHITTVRATSSELSVWKNRPNYSPFQNQLHVELEDV